MKWGHRKVSSSHSDRVEKRLVKKINKNAKLADKYRGVESAAKAARSGLYSKGPKSKNFANQLVNLNKRISDASRYAKYREGKVRKFMSSNKLKDVTLTYDITSRTYRISDKKK